MDWDKHKCIDCTPHFGYYHKIPVCNLKQAVITDLKQRPGWCPLDDTADRVARSEYIYNRF